MHIGLNFTSNPAPCILDDMCQEIYHFTTFSSYITCIHYKLHDTGILYAKQKHLGCKKMRGQSEATLQTGMCDQKL